MAVEVDELKNRARRAYELGRVRGAVIGILPIVVIAMVAGFVDRMWTPVYYAGPPLLAIAAFLLWRGRHYGRAVLPGVAAGVVPFVAMQIARASGHACAGPACYSVCVPACVIGGAIAGVIIARVAKRSTAPLGSWAAGGVVAALTGALGCACIGIFGVLGLVVGLVVASAPLVLRPILVEGRG
jgi:hypothetical protein